MARLLADQSTPNPGRIDGGTCLAFIGEAIAARAEIQLHCDGEQESLRGTILSERAGELRVQFAVEKDFPWDRSCLASSVLHGWIETHAGRCLFETVCLRTTPAPSATILHLRWPPSLLTDERRRSRRYCFRETTEVVLTRSETSSGGSCGATLLNLSAEGIACRADKDDFADVSIGEMLHVHFCTGRTGDSLELPARVVTITHAGTTGHLMVGMEFLNHEVSHEDREKLQAALQRFA